VVAFFCFVVIFCWSKLLLAILIGITQNYAHKNGYINSKTPNLASRIQQKHLLVFELFAENTKRQNKGKRCVCAKHQSVQPKVLRRLMYQILWDSNAWQKG